MEKLSVFRFSGSGIFLFEAEKRKFLEEKQLKQENQRNLFMENGKQFSGLFTGKCVIGIGVDSEMRLPFHSIQLNGGQLEKYHHKVRMKSESNPSTVCNQLRR